MTGTGTLRHRLALVAVLTTAAWVVALTALFNVLLATQLHNQADDVLRTRAQAALSTVEIDAGGSLTVRETPNDAALDAGIWVYQGTGAVDRPRARPAVQAAADRLAGTRRAKFSDAAGRPAVRLFAQPVRQGGRQVGTVVSATDVEPYRATSRTALLASGALAVLLVTVAYVVTRRVVTRALAPVVEMADQAARWSAHDVGQRFGDAPRPAELRDLAAGLDALLDRIGAVLRHEKQLAAELSHELKTPLSTIAAETELLRTGSRSDLERNRAYRVIAETVGRMDHLLDTLLTQAAQDVTDAPGRCRVEPVARAALTAAGINVQVSLAVEAGLEAGTSPEVLHRILTQLLSNAARYATDQIAVTAVRNGPAIQITVSDDGPGVPAPFRDQVFEPGERADPADGHPGAGLGLALARRLARSAGGDIVLEDTERGAAFAILLPR
jgi:signal transduction histidine kinase